MELHEECLVIKDIVASTMNMTSAIAEEGNIQLANKLADDLPQIYGDERRIRQVLLNLLSNAIKFTPTGGQVTLSVGLDDQDAFVFTVTDTGVGMDEKERAMAMTKFGQVESDLSRRFEGTGLGLPLTESLVQLHGGTLTIVSEKGTGTTVTVRLPAARTMVVSETSAAC